MDTDADTEAVKWTQKRLNGRGRDVMSLTQTEKEGGREAALPRKIPFRRLAQLAFARSRPLFIVGSTQRGRFGLLRCPKKCANLRMPVECRRHAILLSRRDASDVVLSPQVVWDTVVRSFSFTHGDACSRSMGRHFQH